MNIKNLRRKKKRGFTLIELMIVLAVIALIAFIGLPNLTSIKDNVKVKVDKENCRNIERVTTYLMADETLKVSSESTEATMTYTPSESGGVMSNATNISSGEDDLEKLLIDISAPQESGKDSYIIKIKSGGKVEVKTGPENTVPKE